MPLSDTTLKYPLSMRILHWLMAVIILCLIAVGLIMDDIPRTDPLRGTLFSLHKSFGITIFMLFVLRFILRLRLARPALPTTIPLAERKLAELGHWALYGFMVAMPVSGYIMSISYGLPVKWFGLTLPKLVGVDKTRGAFAGDFHAYAAYTLIGLLVLHISAVALHFAKHRVNLIKRML